MARVLMLGRLRDVAGWRERDIEVSSLADLRARLASEDASLGLALAGAAVQAAVDRILVRGDAALTSASEVAFMPPMSGG